MTITIDKLAKILQTLFTTEADTAAKESGMRFSAERKKILRGRLACKLWSCGWLEDPNSEQHIRRN